MPWPAANRFRDGRRGNSLAAWQAMETASLAGDFSFAPRRLQSSSGASFSLIMENHDPKLGVSTPTSVSAVFGIPNSNSRFSTNKHHSTLMVRRLSTNRVHIVSKNSPMLATSIVVRTLI